MEFYSLDGKELLDRMQIKIGVRYINKTWRFLYPCLRGHGETFVKKLNPLFKLAVGINDSILSGTDYSKGRNIFILVDTLYQPKQVKDFMDYIVYQPFYRHHFYVNNYDNTQSRKLMIILTIPDGFENAYDNFILGKYSYMYNNEEIKALFSSPERKTEYDVLTLNPQLHDSFIETINKEFNTKISSFDSIIREYELPLKPKEEIFNYQEGNYYLIKELDKV